MPRVRQERKIAKRNRKGEKNEKKEANLYHPQERSEKR